LTATQPPSATPIGRGPEEDRTYYGRPALKAAPFEKWVVGGYIFLAGLSGAAQLLSTVADLVGRKKDEAVVSYGRWLSALAPTVGSALLIYDLNTPKRFYNMLRILKRTSPMSIGTWLLMAFSAFGGMTLSCTLLAGRLPRLRRVARVTQIPAAVAGAGLSTYTASLLSATSTPLWAAAPKALAIRFGSSSVAAGAAALSLGARHRGRHRAARDLDTLMVVALMVEALATVASENTCHKKRISVGTEGNGLQAAATVGMLLPVGLHAISIATRRRDTRLQHWASWIALAGSLCLRVSVLEAGIESANRPRDYFRFARPENLPPGT
jgi:formate-dependent nitrite reductase membrane component NrfD